jgi:hypothetical protein
MVPSDGCFVTFCNAMQTKEPARGGVEEQNGTRSPEGCTHEVGPWQGVRALNSLWGSKTRSAGD